MRQIMVVILFILVHLDGRASCCAKQEIESSQSIKPKNSFSLEDRVSAELFLNALIACKDKDIVKVSLAEFVEAYKKISDSSDSDSSPESNDSDKSHPKG